LFVEIRRRMGPEIFALFEESIITRISTQKSSENDEDNPKPPSKGEAASSPSASTEALGQEPSSTGKSNVGKLILDATVVEQAIRYPSS